MTRLVLQASWILMAAFAISLIYEFYRAIFKSTVSKWDTRRAFFSQSVPAYVLLFILSAMLRTGWPWLVWLALVVSVLLIGVSIFYYNPVILVAREPQPIDWIEDLVYTGLLFVAAALLIYHVLGFSLVI